MLTKQSFLEVLLILTIFLLILVFVYHSGLLPGIVSVGISFLIAGVFIKIVDIILDKLPSSK